MGKVTLFENAGDAQKLAESLRKTATKQSSGGEIFMKFTKGGEFLMGAESNEVGPDERWAVNPSSFMSGVIGWEDGSVAGEEMYSVMSGKQVDWDALPTIPPGEGNGWSEQMSVQLKSLDEDIEVLFKTSSNGGRSALAELAGEIGKQLHTNPEAPVAVVSLTNDPYKHKRYGKINKPKFVIEGWLDANGEPVKAQRKLV